MMNTYRVAKELIRNARLLQRMYCGRYNNPDEPTLELCHNMARNSFIAHSTLDGHPRELVNRIANRIFLHHERKHTLAA